MSSTVAKLRKRKIYLPVRALSKPLVRSVWRLTLLLSTETCSKDGAKI